MKSIIRGLIWLSALANGIGAALAVTIDDFNEGPIFLLATNFPGPTVLQTNLSPGHVIGGSRSVNVASLGGTATLQINTPAALGQFNLSADASYEYFTLLYGSPRLPLGADLLADGSDRFLIHITSVTAVPTGSFAFRVETGNTWFSSSVHPTAPGEVVLPFSLFSGANLSQVQSIQIDAGRLPQSFQISIDSITTVPEPSELALFAVEVLAFSLALKHLKKHSKAPPA
jgi:hypothetical protein